MMIARISPPISDIFAIIEKHIPIEHIPALEKEKPNRDTPQTKLLTEMNFMLVKMAWACFNRYYAHYCEYDEDGLIVRSDAIARGLVIYRPHLQEFVVSLREPGQFEEATNLFDAYFPKLLIGQSPLNKDNDKLTVKEKRLLISQAYLRHLVIPTKSNESYSIKEDTSIKLYPQADVINSIFNLFEQVIDQGNPFLRNCKNKIEKKIKAKKQEDLNGGAYQTLTRTSIIDLGDARSAMYRKARKLSPSLPNRPVFIDAGGGQGCIAIALAAYLGWLTISVEIFPTKVYVVLNYGIELFCGNVGHGLQATFFQEDVTVPCNWEGVNIFMVWDAAFVRKTFIGIIENIARSKDNYPFVSVMSKRHMNEANERDTDGMTRKEFVEELFKLFQKMRLRYL